MAFGKKTVQHKNFRQAGRRSMQRQGGRRSGGGAPYFINRYKPPTVGLGDTIRLIPGRFESPLVQDGDYVLDENNQIIVEVTPYHKFCEHFHGGKRKSCICSAGDLRGVKGKAQPCIGCDWFWWEWEQRKIHNSDKPRSMSLRDMWSFTVLVMSPFHKIEDIDDTTGKTRMNPKTNQPYYHWVKCDGRGCTACAAGKETKQGHLLHWDMGLGHFNTLLEHSVILGRDCRICGQQNCIEDLAWVCQNPDCGEAVIDMTTTTLKDEEIDKMTSEETTCPYCRVNGYLSDIYRCHNCYQISGGANSGERATLFDVDLTVKRIEASDGTNQTTLQIVRNSAPKGVDKIYGEDLRKSLELNKIFSPTDLERQIGLFGKPPPREGADGQRQPVNT